MGINEGLLSVYERNWDKLKEIHAKFPDLSWPLLMKLNEGYSTESVKLFVIGQQTNGWIEDADSFDELMTGYEKFGFGKEEHKSTLWASVRVMEKRLGIGQGNIAWSELLRMDKKVGDKKWGEPNDAEKDALSEFFPLLRQEINICTPTLIIFFTGPHYDGLITKCFGTNPFASLDVNKVRFSTGNIMGINAYRTYHPEFFAHSGRKDLLEEVLEDIAKDYLDSQRAVQ